MTNPYELKNDPIQNQATELNITIPAVPMPESSHHRIALVGCGAIGKMQLLAYKQAGWNVVLLCSATEESARSARDEFFPAADITCDYHELLSRSDVTVVDLALHLDIRPPFVRDAILAGKHVMSQKPYVERLDEGVELAELADQNGVKLAVNHNGRWAGHFRALREVVDQGHIGELIAADFSVYWPHDEILENHVLGQDPNLVLYDFAIHWFDLVASLFTGQTARSVYAITGIREGQRLPVPTLASVIIDFGSAQASINMRASARQEDSSYFHVSGTRGKVSFEGASLGGHQIEVVNELGIASIPVEPEWFPNALRDTMANLLCAIEQDSSPAAHPRSSLSGLSLCFAALESAATGVPVDPLSVNARHGIDS